MQGRIPYPVFCSLVGVAISWLPTLIHGPIPEKLDVLYIDGSVSVWGWYVARALIGFVVGVTVWPSPWWLRGPFFGALIMLPLGIFSLGAPGCGAPCMAANMTTGAAIGLVVAGVARAFTGKESWR